VLRKLRAFQDLGHIVVFIIGDFTAQIGDPSDKLEKRPMLTAEAIKHNLKTYKEQVGKIIDLSKAEFHYNSTWLSKLRFQEIAELAESFSVQQMTARRNFKDRFDKGEEVSLREFLYPLMQGYDSVAINADVELGGFDQLFNVKAGRVVQKHYGKPEQDVLTVQMLEGTDGRKMSSSWGNIIAIVDEPNDMYGKIMSVRDDLLTKYFLLCTDLSEEEYC
jgi:tyrosyl-tRNA synthetase